MGMSLVGGFLLVGLGGAAGGLVRVWLTAAVDRLAGTVLPWGTLVVNLAGSCAAGAALAAAGSAEPVQPALWLALVVGTLGSFTTVSAFALQVHALVAHDRRHAALAYAGLSVGLCPAFAAAGFAALGTALGP
jgi:fluoride exporter